MEDGREGRRESGPKCRFERIVPFDAGALGAVALRDPDPVDRAEIGGHRREAAPHLVVVDGAVAFVVEDQHDRVDADADGSFELRDRHPGPAVAGQCHDRSSRSRERRRDRGRDREAHRACRRADERARPAQDQAARGPAAEVARVRRDDRVRRKDSVEGRDDAARMHARPVPGSIVDATSVLVGGAIRGRRGAPSLQARGIEHACTKDATCLPKERAGVSRQREGRRREPGTRPERLRVHVRPARPGSRDGVVIRGDLVEAAADHEDRIGIFQPASNRPRCEVAAHPKVARVVVGEDVRPAPRGDDGHLHEIGQANEVRRRPRTQDAAAGEDHRPFGVEQQVEDPANVHRVGGRRARRPERGRGRGPRRRIGDLLGQEVLRQGEEHGPGSAGRGAPERLVERRGQRGRVAHLAGPAAVPADRGRQVHLLESFAAAGRPLHLADQRDDGERIRVGDVEADGQVRGAHGPRPEDRGRVAAERSGGRGHERRAALVARRDNPDPGSHQAVQERKKALSRHGVRDADPGRGKCIGDQPAGRPRCPGHGLPFPSGSWRTGAGRSRRARAAARSPSGGRPCSWRSHGRRRPGSVPSSSGTRPAGSS